MTELRFRQRHVRQTIADYIQAGLTDLGWVDAPVNFGATPLTFQEIDAEETVQGQQVAPNTVSTTLGDEPDDETYELGGGLESVDLPVFIDIYAENHSLAVSIASDVKRLLKHKATPVVDYTGTPTASATEYIEFESVIGPERPPASIGATEFKRHWRVVKAIAVVYFVPD